MLPGLWHWQKNSWKNLFSYVGPGFLVSIAYIDPGNCKIKHSVSLSISLLSLVYPLTFSLGTSCSWDGSTGWSTVQIWGVPYFYLFFPLVCYFSSPFFCFICLSYLPFKVPNTIDWSSSIQLCVSCLSLLKNYDHIILIAASLDHTCCILCCSYYSITCSQARGCDRLVFWPVQQLYLLICYFPSWMLTVCEISPYDRETSRRALQGWISQGHKFRLMDSCWTCSCCLWHPWRYWTYISSAPFAYLLFCITELRRLYSSAIW